MPFNSIKLIGAPEFGQLSKSREPLDTHFLLYMSNDPCSNEYVYNIYSKTSTYLFITVMRYAFKL